MTVIIVAAGSGQRMGFDKLLALVAGKAVIIHTAQAFDRCNDVDHIIVVTDQKRFSLIEKSGISTRLTRVDGGTERHNSVANGLAAVSPETDFIAVHDGARPLISEEAISSCLAVAKEHGAATCAHRISETVKRSDNEDFVTASVSRENLWAMETPQTFQAELLRKAYGKIQHSKTIVTDEVSALELINIKTKLVPTSQPNPKVTYPSDLILAETLFAARNLS